LKQTFGPTNQVDQTGGASVKLKLLDLVQVLGSALAVSNLKNAAQSSEISHLYKSQDGSKNQYLL
jgi:hypothetical protein